MRVLDDSSSCFGDGPQCWPPGFRFHPTDEELVLYYLKRKICRRRLKLDIVGETDVYKWEPEELPGISKLRTGDRQWFFFSPRDRKYPNGARSNRATRHGYWKATGKDRNVTCSSRTVGVKKTLVYYKGRAPSGGRTDWVMHEYTLDEEELKRCPSVQDYYALYKVFKKSGPGPKNGEQYGAPFREEDWAADDENTIVNDHVDQENSAKQVIEAAFVDNTATNGQLQSPFNDLQELMNRIEDNPVQVEPVNVGPPAVDYCYTLQGGVGGEETQSALVDQSLIEGNFHDRSMVLNPSNNGQASFDLTQSANSQMQLYETSDVTSVPNIFRQESNESEVNFLEDYIEMDDLLGPQPTFENIENPVENLQFEDFDGLSELDLYQDTAMFFQNMVPPMNMGPVSHSIQDMGPLNMGPVSQQVMGTLNMGPVSHPIQDMDPINMEPVYQLNFDNIGNEMVNQFDFQLQQHTNDETQINSLLWTPAESNRGTIPPPSSGVVYDAISASLPPGVNQNENQNQNLEEADGRDTWLSSLFWNVVESIPTTPASASESSALVNKALERISSFGRIGSGVRISAGDTNMNAGNPTAAPKKSSNSWYNRLFFIFSLLGVVCAVLWMLRGTSVEVLGRFIS